MSDYEKGRQAIIDRYAKARKEQEPHVFIDALGAVCTPDWMPLFEALSVKDCCQKCRAFDSSLDERQQYMCRCPPHCIGDVLSEETKQRLIKKIEEKKVSDMANLLGKKI
jgi:hypothetical protein